MKYTCKELRIILKDHRVPFSKRRCLHADMLKAAKDLNLISDEEYQSPPPFDSVSTWVPLVDIKGLLVDWALISKADELKVKQHIWRKNKHGYVFNNLNQSLHVFLMGPAPPGQIIDHINHKKTDNRRCNLRFATHQLNSQNKAKRAGTSSQFIGVGWCKTYNKWKATCGRQSIGCFQDETHAAYAYDLHVKEKFKGEGKINGVEKPQDFVGSPKRAKSSLARGVSARGKKFYAYFRDTIHKKQIHLGIFESEKEASDVYEAHRKNIDDEAESKWLKQPILRNPEGIAIIPVTDKGVKNAVQCFVDDDKWHFFMKRTWHLDDNGYVCALRSRMHTEVIKVDPGKIVDHIYSRLDNRQASLRQNTWGGNCHNTAARSKCGLKGVRKIGLRFESRLYHQKQLYHLGFHQLSEVAAYAYDCAARQLYGDCARVNDVPAPRDYKWDSKLMRLVVQIGEGDD